MLLGIWPWLSAIFAGLIGVSLSVIFLSKPRATASESIYDWRNRERTADDIVEDDAVEAVEAEAAIRVEEGASESTEESVTAAAAEEPAGSAEPAAAPEPSGDSEPADDHDFETANSAENTPQADKA